MDLETKIELYKDIAKALQECIPSGNNISEPAYIATLVTKIPQKLESIFNSRYSGMTFKVGGCFIHQKPIARFCDRGLSKKDSEIGDLLLVYKRIQGKEITYNALLFQAKKLKSTSESIYNYKVKDEDKHQLLLYTRWPRFIYQKAGINLNGRKRSVTPKTITPGAQYLLITNKSCISFWCAMPSDILIANNSLALQLIKFIEFQTGRPFVKETPRDSWSQMIWDLLNISFNSVFNLRKYGYNSVQRGSDNIAEFIKISKDIINDTINDDTSGISVLCIQSEDKSEYNRDI